MMTVRRTAIWLGSTLSLLAVSACSGPTINGFTLTAAPAAIAINPGGTSYMTVAASATGKSGVTAAVVIYNLPAGVTAVPASPTVTTGSQTVIALTAADYAVASTNTVQVTGYAGLASSSSNITVGVVTGN